MREICIRILSMDKRTYNTRADYGSPGTALERFFDINKKALIRCFQQELFYRKRIHVMGGYAWRTMQLLCTPLGKNSELWTTWRVASKEIRSRVSTSPIRISKVSGSYFGAGKMENVWLNRVGFVPDYPAYHGRNQEKQRTCDDVCIKESSAADQMTRVCHLSLYPTPPVIRSSLDRSD